MMHKFDYIHKKQKNNYCQGCGQQQDILQIKGLGQHGPAGGLQATSGLRPLLTRPMKLFVNFVVTTSSFIFFTLKD
jgi:hypothetical protein